MTLARRLWLLTALLLWLCWSCSDDTQGSKDSSTGVDQSIADQGVSDSAPGDLAASDATKTDSSSDAAPAPGFPTNLTKLITIGDSLSVGYPSSTGLSYRELLYKNVDSKWPTYKGKDLFTLFPKIAVEDSSNFGATSANLVSMVSTLKGNPQGDTLVVISVGGNDFANNVIGLSLDPNYWKTMAANVEANMKKVLAHFADKKLYPGKVMIVMFVVHDPTDAMGTIPAGVKGLTGFCTAIQMLGGIVGPGVVKQLASYNQSIAAFAKANNIYIADNYTHFLGHGYHSANKSSKHYDAKDPTLWFYTDCLHGNDRGYHEMRVVVWKRITGQ